MAENNFIDSKFRQVILAAKRARQILIGSKKKIDINAENPLTIALEEIKQGKVDFEILLNEEIEQVEKGAEMDELEMESGDKAGLESFTENGSEGNDIEENESDSEEVSPLVDND